MPQGISELDNLIRELTSGNDKKGCRLDFVAGDRAERIRYINFLRKFVYFLPELTPEHLVWDEDAAKEILDEEIPHEVLLEKNFKQRLQLLAEKSLGLNADTIFNSLLNKLLKGKSQRKKALVEVIQKIRCAV